MSNNDLISRSHFDDRVRRIVSVDKELSADYLDGVDMVLYLLSTEPTVPQEMSAREYIITEERCKSWCLSNGGCESCCYHEFCWADAIEPEEYLRFYTLWAKEHPERSEE